MRVSEFTGDRVADQAASSDFDVEIPDVGGAGDECDLGPRPAALHAVADGPLVCLLLGFGAAARFGHSVEFMQRNVAAAFQVVETSWEMDSPDASNLALRAAMSCSPINS